MSERVGPALPGMQFVKFLGAGGFADVFLYERDQPRIKVAVKVMKAGALSDAQRRQFEAEADTMALLAEHPFIVPVLGAGTSPDGRPYLVMTYYPSADLSKRVAQQPMSVAESLRYGIQLASAVETAHRSGIIHRDIKPSNVLMSSYGVMGLSDFGIAGRPLDMQHEDEVGISLPWSPREVVVGDSNGSVQSDVYSLAATVWHLLMGRAPFYVPGGDNSERATFTRIVHEKPPATGRPDAPPSLDRLLQQALAKDPAYRPQSALELAQHFQRIEQELRLARTEVVVLEQPHSDHEPITPGSLDVTDVFSKNRTSDPTAPAASPRDMAATELKPPPRVVAQTPLAPVRPVPAAPGLNQPSAGSPNHDWAASAATSTERPSPVRGSQRAPMVFDKATELRPARVDPSGPTEEPTEAAATGSRWKLIVAAGVLLVAAIGGGLALAGGGGDKKADDPIKTRAPDTSLPGVNGRPAAPAGLRVIAKGGDTVTFGWLKTAGAVGYAWSYDGVAFTRVSVTHAEVKKQPGKTCIVVKANVGGQYSFVSGKVCG